MSYLQYEILHISAFFWFLTGVTVIIVIVFLDFLKAREIDRRDKHE